MTFISLQITSISHLISTYTLSQANSAQIFLIDLSSPSHLPFLSCLVFWIENFVDFDFEDLVDFDFEDFVDFDSVDYHRIKTSIS